MEVQDSHSATLGHSESWANNKRLRVGLTVPSDGVVRLIFRGRVGKDTAFYQIICTEAGSDAGVERLGEHIPPRVLVDAVSPPWP